MSQTPPADPASNPDAVNKLAEEGGGSASTGAATRLEDSFAAGAGTASAREEGGGTSSTGA